MITRFRFHSNDFSKDLTLTLDKDWQRDQLVVFLGKLDTEYPSLNSVREYADRHGIGYQHEEKVVPFTRTDRRG